MRTGKGPAARRLRERGAQGSPPAAKTIPAVSQNTVQGITEEAVGNRKGGGGLMPTGNRSVARRTLKRGHRESSARTRENVKAWGQNKKLEKRGILACADAKGGVFSRD